MGPAIARTGCRSCAAAVARSDAEHECACVVRDGEWSLGASTIERALFPKAFSLPMRIAFCIWPRGSTSIAAALAKEQRSHDAAAAGTRGAGKEPGAAVSA